MASTKVPALLLDPSAAAGVEPVTFPGFPGRFTPGHPVELEALAAASGTPAADLAALAAGLGLPLVAVDVKAGDGSLPAADNHADSAVTFDLSDRDDTAEEAGEEGDG